MALLSVIIFSYVLRMHGINKNYTVPLSNGSHSNLIIMWMGATTTILSLVFHKWFNHTSHNCYVERMQILDHLIIRVENLYSVIFAVTMWIILISCYSFLWTIWRRWMLQAVYVFHSEDMDDPIHARYVWSSLRINAPL